MKRRRAQRLGAGVLAVAVLIDAVVGPVLGARVAPGIAVIAVAAAEETRVPVVVEIKGALAQGHQIAGEPRVRRACLAGRLGFADHEHGHQRKQRQASEQGSLPPSAASHRTA